MNISDKEATYRSLTAKRAPVAKYGPPNVPIGATFKTKIELRKNNIHHSLSTCVAGGPEGVCSILLSTAQKSFYRDDGELVEYNFNNTADNRQTAGWENLFKLSHENQQVIRIVRGPNLQNKLLSPGKVFRYDGLYIVSYFSISNKTEVKVLLRRILGQPSPWGQATPSKILQRTFIDDDLTIFDERPNVFPLLPYDRENNGVKEEQDEELVNNGLPLLVSSHSIDPNETHMEVSFVKSEVKTESSPEFMRTTSEMDDEGALVANLEEMMNENSEGAVVLNTVGDSVDENMEQAEFEYVEASVAEGVVVNIENAAGMKIGGTPSQTVKVENDDDFQLMEIKKFLTNSIMCETLVGDSFLTQKECTILYKGFSMYILFLDDSENLDLSSFQGEKTFFFRFIYSLRLGGEFLLTSVINGMTVRKGLAVIKDCVPSTNDSKCAVLSTGNNFDYDEDDDDIISISSDEDDSQELMYVSQYGNKQNYQEESELIDISDQEIKVNENDKNQVLKQEGQQIVGSIHPKECEGDGLSISHCREELVMPNCNENECAATVPKRDECMRRFCLCNMSLREFLQLCTGCSINCGDDKTNDDNMPCIMATVKNDDLNNESVLNVVVRTTNPEGVSEDKPLSFKFSDSSSEIPDDLKLSLLDDKSSLSSIKCSMFSSADRLPKLQSKFLQDLTFPCGAECTKGDEEKASVENCSTQETIPSELTSSSKKRGSTFKRKRKIERCRSRFLSVLFLKQFCCPCFEPSKTEVSKKTKDPSETVESNKSKDPSETVESNKSKDPSETVESNKSKDPSETVESNKSKDPSETVESNKSKDPSETVESNKSKDPSKTEEANESNKNQDLCEQKFIGFLTHDIRRQRTRLKYYEKLYKKFHKRLHPDVRAYFQMMNKC